MRMPRILCTITAIVVFSAWLVFLYAVTAYTYRGVSKLAPSKNISKME